MTPTQPTATTTGVSEAMVERAAKAAYDVRAKVYGFEFDWLKAGSSRKDHYMAEARAALSAALSSPPGEGVPAGYLPAVKVLPADTLPSGPDHLVSKAWVHEGCAIALYGTNDKMIGWIDTHEWVKGRVYRDRLLSGDGVEASAYARLRHAACRLGAQMSPVDLIQRLRADLEFTDGRYLGHCGSDNIRTLLDSLASKDTALAEIRAELEHARKTAGRIFEEHMALIEERNALADCLNCARMDWEGNNGEIIDKSDPHWTVEARRLCASRALSQDGEDRS